LTVLKDLIVETSVNHLMLVMVVNLSVYFNFCNYE